MNGPSAHRQALVSFIGSLGPGRPMRVAEIGVASGITSELLLRTFPHLTLVMVDPWRVFYPGTRKTQCDYDSAYETAVRRTQFAGDRVAVLRLTSVEAAQEVKKRGWAFDLVFIDGAHFYENVRQDLEHWWPLVKPGGLLTGHDYDSPRNQTGAWGVKRAVDEFSARNGLRLFFDRTVWLIRR